MRVARAEFLYYFYERVVRLFNIILIIGKDYIVTTKQIFVHGLSDFN